MCMMYELKYHFPRVTYTATHSTCDCLYLTICRVLHLKKNISNSLLFKIRLDSVEKASGMNELNMLMLFYT